MKLDVAAIRTDYQQKSLAIEDVLPDPIKQFENWFNEAIKAAVIEPNAMNLATVLPNNRPSSRIVLLKGLENSSFQFYTNYDSNKGKQLSANPYAALTFFWPELERQVRIEGIVTKTSASNSDHYFSSRPRGSKIGAWASPQSQIIEDRTLLKENIEKLNQKYPEDEVPRPEHWGGYQLAPEHIEFWQGRKSRLHDRIAYYLINNNWDIKRLAP